ncbi:predicted protein [Phaeodactylum tricornutum CCAP 1055/1]|jgi:16S rRNA (guanine1516-N2)-methyltransferase|uniref:Uncharacterized protein n=1 Tax=Phaeodactylum tricornutum (strain CCAP 1055/1) TaxID=556484 RepID=B7FXU8_PHATC|nr:predicted protein [Phaeodactylum tricornutum CCAP 1055/1]EEC48606.1 predicted protein [Phaeodactylum tricornutum CCAP 1055/1]|eukprot:XP_002179620.1 predicted protein [Phaeodactylum tricornutum CCAP 1055/1]
MKIHRVLYSILTRALVWLPFRSNQVSRETVASVVTFCSDTNADWDEGALSRCNHQNICVVNGDFPGPTEDLVSILRLPLVRRDELCNVETESTFSQALSIVSYQNTAFGINDYAIAIQSLQHEFECTRSKKSRNNVKTKTKPFYVDFCPPLSSSLRRRISGEVGSDLLQKAISPRKGFPNGAIIYDLTAGFGQDALLMATAGARRVYMVERDPIVAVMLQDALRRLSNLADAGDNFAMDLSPRLSFQAGDGREVVRKLLAEKDASVLPDIVYLDPMFPARKKQASVKKNMQILHSLLETQTGDSILRQRDELELLHTALEAAGTKVVVKRPVHASPLGGASVEQKPSYDIRAPVNRWDVYLK